MVTKCDLVAGFTEYFDDLTQEGRAQVWGVTFPYEQTRRTARRARAFPAEFDALMAPSERQACSRASKKNAGADAARGSSAFRSRWPALRDVLDAVRERRLRVDAFRPADPAARRVLHERHAGRHARSIGCWAPSVAGLASRRRPWRHRPGEAKRISSSGC